MSKQCATLHGLAPALEVLLAGETGVAGVVPRRWERKMLLIDAIRLNAAKANERISIRKARSPWIGGYGFCILPPVGAAAGAGTGTGAGTGAGAGVGTGAAALTDGL